MKNILVSGASGIVGYGILRSLKKFGNGINLIGITIYDDSVAEGFCDFFEQAVPTNQDNYINWLLGVIKKHNVDLLIPGIEIDMYCWVEHISQIEQTGAKILLNNIELIGLCKDKWLFYENLIKNKTSLAIKSSVETNFEILTEKLGLPFILKPKRGYGSKGVVKIEDKFAFLKYQKDVGTLLMAQKFVGNDSEEYTTSAFCDGNGSFYCHMTLKRKLSKDGFTEKAEVVQLDGIEEALKILCNLYKPIGPTDFQFRRHNGVLKLLEINPRISSSTSIRSAFGYNESLFSVEYFLENKIPIQPQIRNGRAIRYIDDFIFYS